MKTLENKIADFLLEGDYKEWDLTQEYEFGACETFKVKDPSTGEIEDLEAVKVDGNQLLFIVGATVWHPAEDTIKRLADYIYGLTGYSIEK